MSSDRLTKLNALLQEEVGKILLREVELEGLLITVVRVAVSPTLEHATVYISVLPENRIHEALEEIDYAIYEIQQQLNHRLSIRTVPKIQFKIDGTEEQAARIEKILEDEK